MNYSATNLSNYLTELTNKLNKQADTVKLSFEFRLYHAADSAHTNIQGVLYKWPGNVNLGQYLSVCAATIQLDDLQILSKDMLIEIVRDTVNKTVKQLINAMLEQEKKKIYEVLNYSI